MRSLTTFLFILSFYSIDAQSLTDIFIKKSFNTKNGFSLPYRIIESNNVTTEKRPLLVFLHGAGERGNDNEKQLKHGAAFLIDAAKKHDAIVIAPQCAESSYWSSVVVDRSSRPLGLKFQYSKGSITNDLAAVMELTKKIVQTHNIDRKRIYVMGLSMGGMGTFELVHNFPKCFAAALPICGGGDKQNYSKRAKKVPFWVFHGDADSVVDVSESREMVHSLQSKGFEVRYTEYPGVNHNSWDKVFAENGLSEWIFNQKR